MVVTRVSGRRGDLRAADYWNARAGHRGSYVNVMWPNPAFNQMVDRLQKRVLLHSLGGVSGQKILDLGCGAGRLSFFLAEHGHEVIGVDFSEGMLARANESLQRRPRGNVRFLQASMNDLKGLGERFDWAVSVACLCYSDTREAFQENIRSLCSLMREGGHILLMEPIHRWWPLRRVCPFPVRDWVEEFQRHDWFLKNCDAMIFVPLKFVCALLPLPASLTSFLFQFGEYLLRIPGLRELASDYKILLLQRSPPSA